MTALMFQTTTSTDSEARATIDQMNRTNTEMFQQTPGRHCSGGYSEHHLRPQRRTEQLACRVLAGMMTLEESLSRVEWVARVLLADR